MKLRMLVVAVVIAIAAPAMSQDVQQLGVPAFSPVTRCDGSHNGDWTRIQSAGQAVTIVVADKTTLCDPYNMPSTQVQFDALRAQPNYQLVLGYVDTRHGLRDPYYVFNTVQNEPNPPSNPTTVQDWYRDYGGHIDGIFFDDGPTMEQGYPGDAALHAYYSNLYVTMKNRPGRCGPNHNQACVMLNSSQYPNNWVMSVADNVVLWERALHGTDMNPPDSQGYLTNFILGDAQQSPAGWYKSVSGNQAEHVIYGATTSEVTDVICSSRRFGYPLLYVHDRTGLGANYSQLSSLFEQTVSFVQGYQFCVDVFATRCGSDSYDPCGTYLPGCQQGLWCPAGYSCRDAVGGGYLDCVPG